MANRIRGMKNLPVFIDAAAAILAASSCAHRACKSEYECGPGQVCREEWCVAAPANVAALGTGNQLEGDYSSSSPAGAAAGKTAEKIEREAPVRAKAAVDSAPETYLPPCDSVDGWKEWSRKSSYIVDKDPADGKRYVYGVGLISGRCQGGDVHCNIALMKSAAEQRARASIAQVIETQMEKKDGTIKTITKATLRDTSIVAACRDGENDFWALARMPY